ncbi:MAG: DNA-directed RNA polymerase subunit alpha [Elusimicrobiales bacterium]|jgi:DNA-directed RNA polymerase subunit alpha|nr:DNA-directed RNA polymerase subunit alpha [Elusimicrobiales bacterium]NLH38528.1 DNA-directed RNA polymerase subunit alpha [Elusimicrobiota bacterium]
MPGFLKEIIIPRGVECVEEKSTENGSYAKFVGEPYEKGYGHTIGNSLRRVLLSSIDGAAVVAVRIKGVNHEYTTIEGIKEDVITIIMNLKKLRVKLEGSDRQTIHISEKGKKVVKASDIKTTAVVEIMNKNLEIATLESGATFEAEIEIARGVGYLTSEQVRETISLPQDYIVMDAIFSPVRKVNYKVENARVGQETDYDKLILEIWTDSTITPKEALDRAGALLKYSIIPFASQEAADVEIPTESEETKDSELEEILDQSVDIIELSQRASNCLKVANIKTIRELVYKTEEDLLSVKNFGEKSLEEIKQKLEEMGLSLGMK